jgi:NADPH:quinone reductase-like Zn-dependent oxidoreductase
VRGRPLAYRPILGVFRPKVAVLGAELAGDVVAVGAQVTRLRAGDRVYGDLSEAGFGAFAELVAVRHDALRPLPASMSYVDAAAIPHAGCLAYQGLVELGGLRDCMKILVNGSGGGVGTLAVQLAKQHDVHVTGVDSAAKHELMRAFGFDQVLDYRQIDFTATGERYDLILDARSTRSPRALARALTTEGIYVTVGGETTRLIQIATRDAITPRRRPRMRVLALKPNRGLDALEAGYEAGALRCAIDGPHPFARLPEMIQRFGEGTHLGKIVIVVDV